MRKNHFIDHIRGGVQTVEVRTFHKRSDLKLIKSSRKSLAMSTITPTLPTETELANFEDLLTFEFDFEKDGQHQQERITSLLPSAVVPSAPICKFNDPYC